DGAHADERVVVRRAARVVLRAADRLRAQARPAARALRDGRRARDGDARSVARAPLAAALPVRRGDGGAAARPAARIRPPLRALDPAHAARADGGRARGGRPVSALRLAPPLLALALAPLPVALVN